MRDLSQRLKDLHDAWTMLDQAWSKLHNQPDSVWKPICHACSYIDKQIAAYMKEETA